ncbi:MAG: hypothetical protein C5B49_06070 [Bdellovibrio sp.]|nr:MAG: hypothetical protein C5B49_06070 [Bdellovibrio sp.]
MFCDKIDRMSWKLACQRWIFCLLFSSTAAAHGAKKKVLIVFGGNGSEPSAMKCWAMSAEKQLKKVDKDFKVQGYAQSEISRFTQDFKPDPGVKYFFMGHSTGANRAMSFVYSLPGQNLDPRVKSRLVEENLLLIMMDGDLPYKKNRPKNLRFVWYRSDNGRVTSNNPETDRAIDREEVRLQMRTLTSSCTAQCRTTACMHYCFMYQTVPPDLKGLMGHYKVPNSTRSLEESCDETLAEVSWVLESEGEVVSAGKSGLTPIKLPGGKE